MLWVLAVACAPPPEPPALPDVILLTAERSPAAEAADRLGTGELVRGVPSSVALRPALATLLTGRLPSHHGVRDPVLHAPVVPTMAEILADRGWSTRSEPGGILHAGERWGFGADGAGPVLVWLHGDDRLDVALAAHDPDSHLVVVGLDGEDDLLWCGPDVADLPATVGHVDVLPTLLAALGVPAALDGRDVRGAESGTLDTEDARGLAFGLGIEANGRARANEAPVLEAAVSPSRLGTWEERGVIAGDPAARGSSRDPAEALELASEVEVHLAAGRLSLADRALDDLEGRVGRSGASARLREAIRRRRERPSARVRRLSGLADPTALERLELAEACLDLGDAPCAFDAASAVLAGWPDHVPARWLRARAELDDPRDAAWLTVHAPRVAAALRVERALLEGLPVDPVDLQSLPPGDHARLLRARAAWSAGRSQQAIEQLDALIRDRPLRVDPRLWRARWALELGEPQVAERLLAPVAAESDGLRAVFDEAMASGQAERDRVDALRAAWRHRP